MRTNLRWFSHIHGKVDVWKKVDRRSIICGGLLYSTSRNLLCLSKYFVTMLSTVTPRFSPNPSNFSYGPSTMSYTSSFIPVSINWQAQKEGNSEISSDFFLCCNSRSIFWSTAAPLLLHSSAIHCRINSLDWKKIPICSSSFHQLQLRSAVRITVKHFLCYNMNLLLNQGSVLGKSKLPWWTLSFSCFQKNCASYGESLLLYWHWLSYSKVMGNSTLENIKEFWFSWRCKALSESAVRNPLDGNHFGNHINEEWKSLGIWRVVPKSCKWRHKQGSAVAY